MSEKEIDEELRKTRKAYPNLTDDQFVEQVISALEGDDPFKDERDLDEYARAYFVHKRIEVEESTRDSNRVLELLRSKALNTGDDQKADEFRKLKKELTIGSSETTDIYDRAEGVVASGINYAQKIEARTSRRLR